MMDNQVIALLQKHKAGNLTLDEKRILESWFTKQAIENNYEINDDDLCNNLEQISKVLPLKYTLERKKIWPRIVAAAAILIFLSIGGYYYQNNSNRQATYGKNDVHPGHAMATLTLASGQQITITKDMKGKLVRQGNTQVQIDVHNAIAYNTSEVNHQEKVIYNTLSTAKGEQSPYPLVLADGTKIWLNAMSSITFPTAFKGKDRTVKITGEAYFEVVHNTSMPFRVTVKDQTVEDIGTHFNVNAYEDELVMKTTLIEGCVRISQNDKKTELKPGQQAILKVGGTNISTKKVNTGTAVAWVTGKFRFADETMPAIMRQLARWYDIDVQYQGDITNDGFNGQISRYKNLSETLQMLESTKLVHFKIEGRRVTVVR